MASRILRGSGLISDLDQQGIRRALPFNHIHFWHWMSGIEETGEFPPDSGGFVRI
jgi:hypothetical protein